LAKRDAQRGGAGGEGGDGEEGGDDEGGADGVVVTFD
jgi:hypothetical protein